MISRLVFGLQLGLLGPVFFFTEIVSHTVMLHCDAATKTHLTEVICAFFMWMVQHLILQTIMLFA